MGHPPLLWLDSRRVTSCGTPGVGGWVNTGWEFRMGGGGGGITI